MAVAFHALNRPFPTCVGMNRELEILRRALRSVPYMRGDEPMES